MQDDWTLFPFMENYSQILQFLLNKTAKHNSGKRAEQTSERILPALCK